MNNIEHYRVAGHDINPEMIALARQVRGLTQVELAAQLDLTQGQISKLEQGLLSAPPQLLSQLTRVLGFPKEFFLRRNGIYGPGLKYMRARQSLPKAQRERIDALSNIIAWNTTKLLHSAEFIDAKIPHIPPAQYGGPERVAQIVREYWELPRGPIANVTTVIENAGIIVAPLDFGTDKWDGMVWHHKDTPPIIYVNSRLPGDRMRFTLCHELAHLLMHANTIPSGEEESEANRFAGELLMPESDIKPYLCQQLTLPRLAELKRYWKVSMQALIMRASNLGVITQRQERYLFTQMGKHNLRVNEATLVEIGREEPTLMDELFDLHLTELNYSPQDLERLLCVGTKDIAEWHFPGRVEQWLSRLQTEQQTPLSGQRSTRNDNVLWLTNDQPPRKAIG